MLDKSAFYIRQFASVWWWVQAVPSCSGIACTHHLHERVRLAPEEHDPNAQRGLTLAPVEAGFFLASITPDFAWVRYTFGFGFLNPGAHLILILIEPVATENIAPCEGYQRGFDEMCSHRETVDVFCMPPGSG